MAVVSNTFEKDIQELLSELPSRARSIVKRRYGLGQAEPMTLEAIGKKEGITRERVRQIENDSLDKIKRSNKFQSMEREAHFIIDLIRDLGCIVAEKDLVRRPESLPIKDKKYLLFFLDLVNLIEKRKETPDFYVRWVVKDTDVLKIEKAVSELAQELSKSKETYQENEVYSKLAGYLEGQGIKNFSQAIFEIYISLSKQIEKNKWGEYGHVKSPFIRPRGMREGAYVALSRAKQPLHFREIAKRIEEFTERPVHVQTVHNELIKDERFVLVGRGLYALQEWGYEPGFIKDVLVRLLRERGAMARDEILDEILKRRQVKPGTVFINLQNKKLFRALEGGKYTLVS